MAGGCLLDLASAVSGWTFPINAVQVQKFRETTHFRADRMSESGLEPTYSLKATVARTIRFEFADGSSVDQEGVELSGQQRVE